jgi:hypothetical protein
LTESNTKQQQQQFSGEGQFSKPKKAPTGTCWPEAATPANPVYPINLLAEWGNGVWQALDIDRRQVDLIDPGFKVDDNGRVVGGK